MSKINDIIQNSKKIAIISHINPDADALCSAVGLKEIILNNYDTKQIDIFADGTIGDLYNHITRNEVINPTPYDKYDVIFVLDSPNLERTGLYKDIKADHIINIDHHSTNEKFGELNFVAGNVSSTCEYIYYLSMANKWDLSNKIARFLYQGIITDTNCFTSSSVKSTTHAAISALMKYKFDAIAIKEHYFNNNSLTKTLLTTKALKTMRVFGNKFITMKIDNDTYRKVGATIEDTLGIVDNGININGISACAIFIESEPNKVYVSLRNRGDMDIASIAKDFGGGGSKVSAAFQFEGEIKECEKQLIAKIGPMLKELPDMDDILL